MPKVPKQYKFLPNSNWDRLRNPWQGYFAVFRWSDGTLSTSSNLMASILAGRILRCLSSPRWCRSVLVIALLSS